MGRVLVNEPHVLPVLGDDIRVEHLPGKPPGRGLLRRQNRLLRRCGGLRYGLGRGGDGRGLRGRRPVHSSVQRRRPLIHGYGLIQGQGPFLGSRRPLPGRPGPVPEGEAARGLPRLPLPEGLGVHGLVEVSPGGGGQRLGGCGRLLPGLPRGPPLAAGERGDPAGPVQSVLDRMVDSGEHSPLADKLHHRLGRVDVHVHLVEGQVNVEHAAGELSLHLPVGVGLLQGGGEQGGLDGPAAAEKGLHGPGAPSGQGLGDKAPDPHALAASVHLRQAQGELPAPGGVDGGEELAVPRRMELLPAVPYVADGHLRAAQGQLAQHGRHSGGLGAVGFHEFQPGRGVVEELAHHHGGALRAPRLLHGARRAPFQGQGGPHGVPLPAGEHLQAADGGDGGQGLPSEAQGADGGQIPGLTELAGGVAEEGGRQLLRRDAAAVVGDTDEGHAAVLDLHHQGGRARVDGVLHQLLDHAGGPLHHLAGGDQVRHVGGQLLNMGHSALLSLSGQAGYQSSGP